MHYALGGIDGSEKGMLLDFNNCQFPCNTSVALELVGKIFGEEEILGKFNPG